MKNYKICVMGGEDFKDQDFLFEKLDELAKDKKVTIITGNEKGVNRLAGEWAYYRRCPLIRYYVEDDVKARDSEMLDEKPDIVVIFPGKRNTEFIKMVKERKIQIVKCEV